MAAGRVAVIGAGLAGLSAALDLVDAGFSVELFERSKLLGGRATSFVIDGIEVDNGQHVFLGCCVELVRFIERVGMAACLRMQERFEALVLTRDGQASRLRAAALPPPWHLLASFIGYRHIGWPAKIRIARALARAGDVACAQGTFAQWLAQRGQTEDALRGFWRPFFVPALNAPLDEVSAADAAVVLSTAFLGDADSARFGYTTVPLAHVAAAAAARLGAVHLSTPVAGLDASRERSCARGIVLTDGTMLPFDAVVIAVAPPHFARIAADNERLRLAAVDGYTPHAIVDVHLWHDRGRLGFDFAALLDSPVQWIFEKESGYLCCSLSAADRYLNAATADVVSECWSAAVAAIGALRGAQLKRSAVTRNPEATYTARRDVRRPVPATGLSNVAIAGSWTDTGWPDTMESAVRSGRAAARHVALALRGDRVA
jgi:squalene-associated FAD-dependent desaturase